jgi:protein SCO1/2
MWKNPLVMAALGGALVAALLLGWLISLVLLPEQNGPIRASQGSVTGVPSIGGPFDLVDEQGRPRRDADFRGKLMLIYFGYTHCPDVCPTSLQIMGNALDLLPAETVAQVAPIFITIDPERDTVAGLKGYAEQFHPQMLGLTGSPEQVAAAAKAYRVFYRKGRGEPDSYLVEHSSIVYLMGRDGRYLTHFTHEGTAEQIAAAIRKVL